MTARWLRTLAAHRVGGLLVGVVLVAAVTGVVALLQHGVPVLSLLILYLLAVLPVAAVWGAGDAALTSILSVVVFALLFLPPVGSLQVADAGNIAALIAFLVTAVVVAELSARARRAAREAERLTREQSALRRVATLVAQASEPSDVFEAVTREVGLLSGADFARLERYEPDGTVTGVAAWSAVGSSLAVGTSFGLEGLSIARDVRRSGRPVRLGSFAGATGGIAEEARAVGIRSSVGCPVLVAGRLWGVIAASTKSPDPFPENLESQIARFTELVAAAVENAETRTELRRRAEEQAALRRVATLVARGAPADAVLAAVADEVGSLSDADVAMIFRAEPDGGTSVVATNALDHGSGRDLARRWALGRPLVVATVLESATSARVDVDEPPAGGTASSGHAHVRSVVAGPIVVEGQCWGAIAVASLQTAFPVETERRMVEFTEIVATAIANAEQGGAGCLTRTGRDRR